MMTRRGLAALALVAFTIGFAFAGIRTAESLPAFKSIDAGKGLCIDPATQGSTSFSDALYFTAYSRVATGAINDFANVKLGAAGYVMPRLGFCSDTITAALTLTGLSQYSVTYTMSAAGSSRVWCPDRGEPVTVTGAGAGVWLWDAVNQVATVSSPGAGAVTLTWTAASTSIDLSSWYSAFSLLAIVPVVMGALVILGALRGMDGGDMIAAVIITLVFTIAGVLSVLIFSTVATSL